MYHLKQKYRNSINVVFANPLIFLLRGKMSFLRLKRKINEDPKEILVLASKKKKIENIQQDASIFEFTGTTSQKDDIDGVIATKINDIRDTQVKKFNIDKITDRLRSEHLQRSKHNRLSVLNCIRKIEDDKPEKSVTIIDVSSDESSHTEQDSVVYDIYYSKTNVDIKDAQSIEDCEVHEINSCTWEDANSSEDDSHGMDDEDDSNDENNWRNDYPDEDNDLDSDEEDEFESMSRRLKQSRLSDDSLSSDDFDEGINDDLFGTHRRRRKNSDIDYYDEVVSDESDSFDEYES